MSGALPDPAAARARAAAAHARLRSAMAHKIEALRGSLERSSAPVDTAPLVEQLALLDVRASSGVSPAMYLSLRREMDALWQELYTVESEHSEAEQRGRAALAKVAQLLHEVVPEQAPRLSVLLDEMPIDQATGQRLEAVVLLIRARLELVPRLMGIRSVWKR